MHYRYQCPDCDSTSQLVEQAPRIYTLTVAHDDTCPWLAAYEARR